MGCFVKKVENGGCFGKKMENGFFFVKKWTFPQRSCTVSAFVILHFTYLGGGVRTHPTHPCLRAWSNFQTANTRWCARYTRTATSPTWNFRCQSWTFTAPRRACRNSTMMVCRLFASPIMGTARRVCGAGQVLRVVLLAPYESTSQTASRSVYPFLQGHDCDQWLKWGGLGGLSPPPCFDFGGVCPPLLESEPSLPTAGPKLLNSTKKSQCTL